jgi:hypothetical protein
MAQVEEAEEHLQKANGKKNMSELALSVKTVQAVETRVCNNPSCAVF